MATWDDLLRQLQGLSLATPPQFASGPSDPDPIGDLLTRNPSWSGGAYLDFRPSANVEDQSKDPWFQEFAKVPTGLNLDYHMQNMVPGYYPLDPFDLPTTPLSKAAGQYDLDKIRIDSILSAIRRGRRQE